MQSEGVARLARGVRVEDALASRVLGMDATMSRREKRSSAGSPFSCKHQNKRKSIQKTLQFIAAQKSSSVHSCSRVLLGARRR
jgi:hypothetical protein